MPKLDGLKSVLSFIRGLPPKVSAQILKKVSSLNVEPFPHDSKSLTGYPDLHRVDIGEYRIVYRFIVDEDIIQILLVDKRNDDEVYKHLKRILGS